MGWAEPGEGLQALPSLEKALKLAESRAAGTSSPAEVATEVKINYDLILVRREQLKISKEVRGHFEKAVKEAEKKFEKEDEDITQSAITKLKLGLAGTLNDISRFESDISLARLHLERLLKLKWAAQVDLSGPKFKPVDFPYRSVKEYGKNRPALLKSGTDLYDLREAMIRVNKARAQLELGQKNRKMTRALLVTEVANYDFGIGNEGDLFEALMIYTRVLVGYYDAIHDFNVSVYHFIARVPAP